jgi:hypothetical protein
MGEMAEMSLASQCPYDSFERSGEPGGSGSAKYYDTGILQSKDQNHAIIDGKSFKVTDKATKFLMYIPIGSRVNYRYFSWNDEIYYIKCF